MYLLWPVIFNRLYIGLMANENSSHNNYCSSLSTAQYKTYRGRRGGRCWCISVAVIHTWVWLQRVRRGKRTGRWIWRVSNRLRSSRRRIWRITGVLEVRCTTLCRWICRIRLGWKRIRTGNCIRNTWDRADIICTYIHFSQIQLVENSLNIWIN